MFSVPPPQMFLEYGFHPRVQRWVIGQSLCASQRSLASYGVRQDGDTAFLYLLSARHARLTPQVLQQDQESALLLGSPSLHNPPLPSTSTNGTSSQDRRPYTTLPPRLNISSSSGKCLHLQHHRTAVPSDVTLLSLFSSQMSVRTNRADVAELRDLINLEMPQLNEALNPNTTYTQVTHRTSVIVYKSVDPEKMLGTNMAQQCLSVLQGWSCPSCTYINKPTRPGCEICSTNRPASYIVPGGYRPDTTELKRIQQEKEAIRQYQQVGSPTRLYGFYLSRHL